MLLSFCGFNINNMKKIIILARRKFLSIFTYLNKKVNPQSKARIDSRGPEKCVSTKDLKRHTIPGARNLLFW